jgi:hypothetical protein
MMGGRCHRAAVRSEGDGSLFCTGWLNKVIAFTKGSPATKDFHGSRIVLSQQVK